MSLGWIDAALPILPRQGTAAYKYICLVYFLNIYVLYIFGSKRYRKSNNRKMLRRRELFPAVKAVLTATLRKGHRDLPVFFDELNDAFEARTMPRSMAASLALCGRCSPVTMVRTKRSFIRWRKRGEPAIKIPSK